MALNTLRHVRTRGNGSSLGGLANAACGIRGGISRRLPTLERDASGGIEESDHEESPAAGGPCPCLLDPRGRLDREPGGGRARDHRQPRGIPVAVERRIIHSPWGGRSHSAAALHHVPRRSLDDLSPFLSPQNKTDGAPDTPGIRSPGTLTTPLQWSSRVITPSRMAYLTSSAAL
jgi:hypothetical protein